MERRNFIKSSLGIGLGATLPGMTHSKSGRGISGLNLLIFHDSGTYARLDIFPIFRTDGECLIKRLLDYPRAVFLAFPDPSIQIIIAIRRASFRKTGISQ